MRGWRAAARTSLVGAVCQHVACPRVAAADDAAPVTVAADARDADRTGAKARRCITIEELFGAPRYGSLPDEVRDAVSREWERLLALHAADPEAAAARDSIALGDCRGAARRWAGRRRPTCGACSTKPTSGATKRRRRCSTTWWRAG